MSGIEAPGQGPAVVGGEAYFDHLEDGIEATVRPLARAVLAP